MLGPIRAQDLPGLWRPIKILMCGSLWLENTNEKGHLVQVCGPALVTPNMPTLVGLREAEALVTRTVGLIPEWGPTVSPGSHWPVSLSEPSS